MMTVFTVLLVWGYRVRGCSAFYRTNRSMCLCYLARVRGENIMTWVLRAKSVKKWWMSERRDAKFRETTFSGSGSCQRNKHENMPAEVKYSSLFIHSRCFVFLVILYSSLGCKKTCHVYHEVKKEIMMLLSWQPQNPGRLNQACYNWSTSNACTWNVQLMTISLKRKTITCICSRLS